MMSTFDWNSFNPKREVAAAEILPDGVYNVQICGARWADTRAGGRIFLLTFEVLDGDYKGATTTLGFNLVNKRRHAARIARATLGRICLAAGMASAPQTEDDFIGLTLSMRVGETDYNGRRLNRLISARPIAQTTQTDRSTRVEPSTNVDTSTGVEPYADRELPWLE